MKSVVKISIALGIAICGANSASAEAKKVGSEAGWDIFVNDTMGPGCLIAQKLNPETQVQMGIDATATPLGYMAVYTKAPAQVNPGDVLSVVFDVDGQKFTGEAKGLQMEGFRGASVAVNNLDFIYDLAKKKTLTITPDGRDPIVVNLSGTDAAFKALRECQQKAKPM